MKEQKHDKSRRAQGFTLIELLVVIAIIAILAAILFPVFARARENARKTSCLSNLKQIGLGIMQYTQDYDEAYPLGLWDPQVKQTTSGTPGATFLSCHPYNGCGTGHWVTWMDIIYPYTKSVQVYVCPSATKDAATPSYAMSNAFTNRAGTSGNYDINNTSSGPLKLAGIQRPSEIVMVMDLNDRTYTGGVRPYTIRSRATHADPTLGSATPHLEGGNVAYADGHAKWRSDKTILSRIGNGSSSSEKCDLDNLKASNPNCSPYWNPYIS